MKTRFTILKKPLLTEKTYLQGQVFNTYSFVVDRRADKLEIKENIERLFSVKVKEVRTMKIQDKEKKVGKFVGIVKGQKKALVTLFPEYTLDFFGESEVDEKDKKKKEKEAKKTEKVTKKSEKKDAKAETKEKTTKKVSSENKIEKEGKDGN